MAEIANTAWYRLGMVSATDGSTKVTGDGTHFTTAGINPGATFRIDGHATAHEVAKVVSDTELELARAYYGGTVSNATYSIDRNFQSTLPAKIAADVTSLTGIYEQVRDGVYLTIEGRSAYQIAVAHGYTGTEAQWLASLKGNAEEIAAINAELEPISIHTAYAHNAIYGGRNLGTTITAEQIANVRNGTFKGLYPGDFWRLAVDGGTIAEIAGCNIYPRTIGKNHIVVTLLNYNWIYPLNDIKTCEGHLPGSKLFNETFPALVEKLNAVINPDYIFEATDSTATAINAEGKVTTRGYPRSRLFLPSCQNLNMKDMEDPANQAYEIFPNAVWPRYLFNTQLPYHNENAKCYFWTDANLTATTWQVFRAKLRVAGWANPDGAFLVFPYMFIA